MASDGNGNFAQTRDRLGAFRGQPAPAPDKATFVVPGEARKKAPSVSQKRGALNSSKRS